MDIVREDETEFEQNRFLSWIGNAGWNTFGEEKFGTTEYEEIYGKMYNEYPVYRKLLSKKLLDINDNLELESEAEEVCDEFLDRLSDNVIDEGLLEKNGRVHSMFTKGIKLELSNREKEEIFEIFDYKNIELNQFDAIRQFEFGNKGLRPDICLLVNGIVVIVGELKKTRKSNQNNSPIESAIDDIKQYEEDISKIFSTNILNFVSTDTELRYGSLGSGSQFYFPWKPEDLQSSSDGYESGLEGYDVELTVKSLLHPRKILQICNNYTMFKKERSTISSKIIPRHHQYFASKKIMRAVQDGRAKRLSGRLGLVWHTQGSGKTYTMYYCARYFSKNQNSLSIVVVDRNNLRQQASDELSNLVPWFNDSVEIVDSADDFVEALGKKGKMVVTSLQLFGELDDMDGMDFPSDFRQLTSNKEVIVFADEAHRAMDKNLGDYLQATFDRHFHFGFTGTPVVENNRNTFENYTNPEVIGQKPPLHRYSLETAKSEGVILPVISESRRLEFDMDKEGIIEDINESEELGDDKEKAEIFDSYVNERNIASLDNRIGEIAEDIARDYEDSMKSNFKAIVVTSSREAAAKYCREIRKNLEYSKDSEEYEKVEVVYSNPQNEHDADIVNEYAKSKSEIKDIIEKFKEEKEEYEDEFPEILVVSDMLLTGFDAPILKKMYLDKSLSSDHQLLQAVSRVNRPDDKKTRGEIVEYRDILRLDQRFEEYQDMKVEVIDSDGDTFFDSLVDKTNEVREIVSDISDGDKMYVKDVADKLLRDKTLREDYINKYTEFKNRFRDAQPDQRLTEDRQDWDNKSPHDMYEIFSSIYSYISDNGGGGSENNEILHRILVKNSSFKRKDEEETDYQEVSRNAKDNIRVKIVREANNIEQKARNRVESNPSYKEYIERIKSILQRWHEKSENELTDEEVIDEIEEMKEDMSREPEKYEPEYVRQSVKSTLDKYSNEVDNYKSVVDTTVEEFNNLRDLGLDKYSERKELKSELDKEIGFTLGEKELVRDTNYVDEVSDNLCSNRIYRIDESD